MATLRELRRQLHTIGNIEKITQAMEVVAASRLKRAQAKAEQARPYYEEMKAILERVIAETEDLSHPLMDSRNVKKTGLIIVSGDRGLCGSYNQAIFNAAEKFLQNMRL
jgi:F-type H+-transporting ATPase subunit gamma